MSNHIIEMILRHKRIIPVIVALVGIAGYMIPTNSLALAAITGSGNVAQTISQSNSISATNTGKYGGAFADNNVQLNSASNSAFVSLISGWGSGGSGSITDSGNVLQLIDQANSISASNSGDHGTASASDNIQANDASNNADVHIKGKKIEDSGNVLQAIAQSNSISADNSGASGTATADHNTQVNSASNDASVHIKGKKIENSGNVLQTIDQSNSISASNSGDHGTASASGNTQVNDAHNHADVHIKGKKIEDSGNVAQSIHQSNSVSASNSGDHGTASASGNTQSNSASNNADVHIKSK